MCDNKAGFVSHRCQVNKNEVNEITWPDQQSINLKFHNQKWMWAEGEAERSDLSAVHILHPETPTSVSARLSKARLCYVPARAQNIFSLVWTCAEMGAGSFGTICSGLTISWISEVYGPIAYLHCVIFAVAQEQRELIYLRRHWRGQHFFHTSEKGLGWRREDSVRLVFGVCACVCVKLCSKTCVRLLAVLWGMVLLGSSVKKPNTDWGFWEVRISPGWLGTPGGLISVALWRNITWSSRRSCVSEDHQLQNKQAVKSSMRDHAYSVYHPKLSKMWKNTLFISVYNELIYGFFDFILIKSSSLGLFNKVYIWTEIIHTKSKCSFNL